MLAACGAEDVLAGDLRHVELTGKFAHGRRVEEHRVEGDVERTDTISVAATQAQRAACETDHALRRRCRSRRSSPNRNT